MNKALLPSKPAPSPVETPKVQSIPRFGTEQAPTTPQSIKKVEIDPKRKKRPVVVLPPTEEAAALAAAPTGSAAAGKAGKPAVQPAADRGKALPFWVLPALGVVLLLLVALGVYIYQITRETSVEIRVATGELSISGNPLVVYNFDGQVAQIKRDYIARRTPMEARLAQIEGDFASAKADLAGREEKKRILTNELKKLKDSIPAMMTEASQKLDRLWKEEGGALDKAYAEQKEALHQEIEKRVKELGLNYTRNPELDALEVAVNAFRLSLYGAAKTINVDEQRTFSEDILKRWKEFETDWSQKQLEIKDKALVIKQAPGPRIEEVEKSMENLRVELDALNIELASLQEEVNRRQQEEVEEQEKLREAEKPFLADMLKVPENNILEVLNRDTEGLIRLRDLEKNAKMPPGDYLFLFRPRRERKFFGRSNPSPWSNANQPP
ncbi:MAG: hypothetical protein HC904_15675 [Blastochloris sp.]|nr:hypothetical protein [Blastochloris sp.]